MSMEEGLVERVAELVRECDAAVARAEKAELAGAEALRRAEAKAVDIIAHLERRLAAADALAEAGRKVLASEALRTTTGLLMCAAEPLHEALRVYEAAKEQPAQGGPTT